MDRSRAQILLPKHCLLSSALSCCLLILSVSFWMASVMVIKWQSASSYPCKQNQAKRTSSWWLEEWITGVGKVWGGKAWGRRQPQTYRSLGHLGAQRVIQTNCGSWGNAEQFDLKESKGLRSRLRSEICLTSSCSPPLSPGKGSLNSLICTNTRCKEGCHYLPSPPCSLTVHLRMEAPWESFPGIRPWAH